MSVLSDYTINFPSHTPEYEYTISLPCSLSFSGPYLSPGTTVWNSSVSKVYAYSTDSIQILKIETDYMGTNYLEFFPVVLWDTEEGSEQGRGNYFKVNSMDLNWHIMGYGDFISVDLTVPANALTKIKVSPATAIETSGTFPTTSILSTMSASIFKYEDDVPDTYNFYINDTLIGTVSSPFMDFSVQVINRYNLEVYGEAPISHGDVSLVCNNNPWVISGFKNLQNLIVSGGGFEFINVSSGVCTLKNNNSYVSYQSWVHVRDELMFAVQFNPSLAGDNSITNYKVNAAGLTGAGLATVKWVAYTREPFGLDALAGVTYTCSCSGAAGSKTASSSTTSGMVISVSTVFPYTFLLSDGPKLQGCVYPYLFDAEENPVTLAELPIIKSISPTWYEIENGEIDSEGRIVSTSSYPIYYYFKFSNEESDRFRYFDYELKKKNAIRGTLQTWIPPTYLSITGGSLYDLINRDIPYATDSGYLASDEEPTRLLDKARLVTNSSGGFYKQLKRLNDTGYYHFNSFYIEMGKGEFTVPTFSTTTRYLGFAYVTAYSVGGSRGSNPFYDSVGSYLVLDDTYASLNVPSATDFLSCETADRTQGTYEGADYLAKLSDLVLGDSSNGYYCVQPISDFRFMDCDYSLLDNLSGVGGDGLVTIDVVFFRGIQLLGTRCQELQTSRSGYSLPKGPNVWVQRTSNSESDLYIYGLDGSGSSIGYASFGDFTCNISVLDYWYTIDKTGYIWRNNEGKILHLDGDSLILRGSLYDND